jgi:Ca2+-binding EF-hand superfamily protein
MYDKDCSGTIELSEMTEVIQTLYAMEGSVTDDEGASRATRCPC